MRTKSIFAAALFLLLASVPALGVSVRQVNLAEMVAHSGKVFYGTCVSAETQDSALGLPVRVYRFRVMEALKGVDSDQLVEFRQLASGQGAAVPGIPQYRKGQSVLLFLHADSRLGLTSPVGMGQGTFRARRGADGELMFENAYGNSNLGRELQQRSRVSASALSPAQLEALEEGGPIRWSTLRDAVIEIDRALEQTKGAVQ